MARTAYVPDILQEEVLRLLRIDDLEDVIKKGPAGPVLRSFLPAGLGEGLTWEARAENIVIGNPLGDLSRRAESVLVFDVLARDLPDIGDENPWSLLVEDLPVDLLAVRVHLAGEDTMTSNRLHGMVKTTNAGEKVNESEASIRPLLYFGLFGSFVSSHGCSGPFHPVCPLRFFPDAADIGPSKQSPASAILKEGVFDHATLKPPEESGPADARLL